MSLPAMMDSSKYVISLDSLDLGLLPTPYQPRLGNNTTSLWSTSNLNGDANYYQFEIKTKSDETASEVPSVDDQTSDQTQLRSDVPEQAIMCYICNLKVPAAYMTDHQNSVKHKAFAKIAEVVLDRARQYMLKSENNINVQRIDSMHFCGACVSVVRASDRHNHEKSSLHKRSVSLDRLLHELVALYTEHDGTENDMTATDLKNDKNVSFHNMNVDEIDTDSSENTVLVSDIKTCMDKHENGKVEYSKDTNVNLRKNVKKKNLTPPVYMTIETLDGHKILVPEDNFHGFIRIGNRHIQCKLCKIIFKDEEQHKTSEEHSMKVDTPFKDKHCVRILNNSWSHCVICNEIIENSDVHALCNENHEERLQQALVTYKDPSRSDPVDENTPEIQSRKTSDSSEHYCSTCNLVMHVNNIDSHVNGTKHSMNSKSNLHYIMKPTENSDELLCRVCYSHVKDSPSDVEEHIKTSTHFQKTREFLSANHVTKRADEFYCKPCDLKIANMNEFYHIERLTHVAKLVAYKENMERIKPETIDDTNNNESKIAKSNSYYCHVCCVYIPNNPHNIKSHQDGNKHKKNVHKVVVAIDNAMQKAAAHNIHYQMELTENDKELKCKACESIVPNREEHIEEHVIGIKHRNKVKKILEDNRIERQDDKYVCKVCNVTVSNEYEFVHIKLPAHVQALNALSQENKTVHVVPQTVAKVKPKNTVSELTENRNVVSPTTSASKNASINLYSLLRHHFADINDNPMSLMCKICNISIPNTEVDVLNHANEEEHMVLYKHLMCLNLIFETDRSVFYCGICNCIIPGKGEIHHMLGSRHSNNYIAINSKDNCDLCNVQCDMTSHVTTHEHIVKLKQKQTLLYHCEFCDALITLVHQDIVHHVAYCDVIKEHKLVIKEKICFCIICDLYFTRELIDEHLQSKHHLLLYNMMKRRG